MSRKRKHANPSELVSAPWTYSGDGDLSAGGLFVKADPDDLKYGYCTAVEVTDLASAAGAERMCLIEKGTVNLGFRHVRASVKGCGWIGGERYWQTPKAVRRCMLVEAVKAYYGMEVDESEIVQSDPSYGMKYDGWTAGKVIDDSDLPGYVVSKYID